MWLWPLCFDKTCLEVVLVDSVSWIELGKNYVELRCDFLRSKPRDLLADASVDAKFSRATSTNFDAFLHRFHDLGHNAAASISEIHAGYLREALASIHLLVDVRKTEKRSVEKSLDQRWVLAV